MRMAIIPARGGSKRIPKKNIKLFRGHPIIAWSIMTARETNLFDRIVVSTDDDEIAEIAKKYKAIVPFNRPTHLSDDFTTTSPVVAHAIEWHLNNGFKLDSVCCMYATAPFMRATDICKGFDTMNKKDSDFCLSVTSYSFPVQRAFEIGFNGRIKMLQPSNYNMRSQDLPETYHDAGQFYWGKIEAWLSGNPIFGKNATTVILPRYRVQDIDTLEDWHHAELMHDILQNKIINK